MLGLGSYKIENRKKLHSQRIVFGKFLIKFRLIEWPHTHTHTTNAVVCIKKSKYTTSGSTRNKLKWLPLFHWLFTKSCQFWDFLLKRMELTASRIKLPKPEIQNVHKLSTGSLHPCQSFVQHFNWMTMYRLYNV